MQFNNQINYARILSLLAFSIVTITILLYMALTEGKPEDYKFIGDWSCITKDKKSKISLTITENYFSVNNKKVGNEVSSFLFFFFLHSSNRRVFCLRSDYKGPQQWQ